MIGVISAATLPSILPKWHGVDRKDYFPFPLLCTEQEEFFVLINPLFALALICLELCLC